MTRVVLALLLRLGLGLRTALGAFLGFGLLLSPGLVALLAALVALRSLGSDSPALSDGEVIHLRKVIRPDHGNLHLDVLLDCLETVDELLVRKGNCLAALAGSGCSADAVHIVLIVLWDVVVDHQRKIIDLKAAGCDIGSYQNGGLAVLELVQGLLSLGLGKVSGKVIGVVSVVSEPCAQLLGHVAAVGEHQGRFGLLGCQ